MAEYCLTCWNKMHDTNYTEGDVEMSECLYICEGCERYTWVVMRTLEAREPYWGGLFTWPLALIGEVFLAIGRGVRVLYRYYKKCSGRKNDIKASFNTGEPQNDENST